ncbi:hypothetical protein OS493_026922 [Desmophyllum pertusum]|uniref:Ectonucleotide pyrophosphatase/phosphodiesterase family member 6 n=1 Tax=Desmophyllum pertusum TaxID=174260 RepID=A0A9X0CR78_9CNID|nr:hypothetical protein OS493_026922 [Desmophyllum pertusum]
MDGMRWQYIDDEFASTSNLDSITRTGVTAKFIKTVVPSKTWPNHHSFLTGLYSESHGIVSNRFWDPVCQEKFVLNYDCANYDSKFYSAAEPIWLTLQKSGERSAVYFWPGFAGYSEKPTFYEKPAICPVNCSDVNPKDLANTRNTTRSGWPPYIHCMVNHSEPSQQRIDKIMTWLKSDTPPRFVALYIEQPDSTGHGFGIITQQYKDAMEAVDRDTVGYLMNSLKNANLFDKVNVIFVSDHSMTNTSSARQIFLEDYINLDEFQLVEGGAVGHIWAADEKIDEIYQNLTRANSPYMAVYKKENILDEYHWKHNRRIPPIFIDPAVGWVIRRSRAKARPGNWTVGDHGWPAIKSKSYSVFFAHGPAFQKGLEVSPFNTVDLYPLMCKLLGIMPRPNNGSLEDVKMMLKEYAQPASKPTTKGAASTCQSRAPIILMALTVTFFIRTAGCYGLQ